MAKKYLDQLRSLFQEIGLSESDTLNLEFKHFFSGAALYADGNICITLTPVGFALKLPKSLISSLLESGEHKRLKYFPKAPIKKDYVVLSDDLFKDHDSLVELIRTSIKFVGEKP